MTNDPRKTRRERQTQPAADSRLEIRPEVIQDLEVIADDTPDVVGGGCCFTKPVIQID
jgi:hypothetical protein